MSNCFSASVRLAVSPRDSADQHAHAARFDCPFGQSAQALGIELIISREWGVQAWHNTQHAGRVRIKLFFITHIFTANWARALVNPEDFLLVIYLIKTRRDT